MTPPRATTATLGEHAAALNTLIEQLKHDAAPTPDKVVDARQRIEAALAQQHIDIAEWRLLMERCAQIRRVARPCPS
jgi:hypothetical protein